MTKRVASRRSRRPTLVLVCLPALWLAFRTLFIGLGPRPIHEATLFLGTWTIYFLLMTLAVTPARRLFEWSKLIQIRRILGLTALTYILAHLSMFIIDSKFNLVTVAQEIALRIYLTIGFTALLGLVALGVTSTDGMVRRMGARNWNRLHRLVYAIGFLGFLHFYMQAKADVTQPVLFSGFFFWLMGYRIMARYGYKQGLVPLTILSFVSGANDGTCRGWLVRLHAARRRRPDGAPGQSRFQLHDTARLVGAGGRPGCDRSV